METFMFLSDPTAFYMVANRDSKFYKTHLKDIDLQHPSVLNENATNYPARNALKEKLLLISSVARHIVERGGFSGQNVTQMEFYNFGITRLKVEKDDPETGMFQKFFEGNQTLEAVCINILQLALFDMKSKSTHPQPPKR
jgi:hypothetical protein